MWAKIITIKRTKDLNYFSLCALNLFNTRVSQFELNYWNKWTFPQHSNLLRCTCICIWMNEWCIYIALYCVLYTQSALQSYIYMGMAGRWNGWSFLLIPFPAILWVCFPLLHFNCYCCTRYMCLTCAIAFCFVSVFDYGCLSEKKVLLPF